MEETDNEPRAKNRPTGVTVILVYLFLSGTLTIFAAGSVPSNIFYYLGYGILCLVAIVEGLRKTKLAWYLLVLVLGWLFISYSNTLAFILMNGVSPQTEQLVLIKVLQVISHGLALLYLFTPTIRKHFGHSS